MEIRIDIGTIIKRQRISIPLTLQQLAQAAGISPSYIGRIERGQRFPSARILVRLAKPLGLAVDELFALAGYLSPIAAAISEKEPEYAAHRLDPYVVRMLSREPVSVQRSVITILTLLKTLSQRTAETEEGSRKPPAKGRKKKG